MGNSEGQIARLDEKVITLARSHSELRERFDELEDVVNVHTVEIDKQKLNSIKIDEMHKAFTRAQSGFVVLEWIGKAFIPLLTLLAAVGIWIKTGVWDWKP